MCKFKGFLFNGTIILLLTLLMLQRPCGPMQSAMAQTTVTPTSISIGSDSNICSGGSEDHLVSIELPPEAILDKVDVILLFDDTGSFAGFVPTVVSIFADLVGALETALPTVDFGFGVSRFEDYGGPGTGFSGEVASGRPFILNQPIITGADAIAAGTTLTTLINTALGNTAPGFGGDGPESAISEGLTQLGTGLGFDGNGNGNTTDSGAAGALGTQTAPGTSGDVPAFSTNVLPTSGTLGGAGWRAGALHIVILATDICPISAHPVGAPIPATITNPISGGSEPTSALSCSSSVGFSRFGFVSDSKTFAGNTVASAVVPLGATTVQECVDALASLGIRVIGMGPGAGPTSSAGPSFSDESVFLSALARLTGAVDDMGVPLVFSTSVSLTDLTTAIADSITTTATVPVDITLIPSSLPAGLLFLSDPDIVPGVPPGGLASFLATFTGDGSPVSGAFDLNFVDDLSGVILGNIPVTVACSTEHVNCNDEVTFNVIGSTIAFDPAPVPGGPAGTFSFDARMTTIGTSDLEGITTPFAILTNGNKVLNADGGPSGVPGTLTVPIPSVSDYSDGILSPGETVDVHYDIGLNVLSGFSFFVDVFCVNDSAPE